MLSSKKLIMTESNVDWMQLIIDTTHGALDLYSAVTKHWWGLLSIFHNVCIKSNSSHKQKRAEGMLWDLHCSVCLLSLCCAVSAAVLWGRHYHRGAGAVHPSNLSNRQDNLQYICGPKLGSASVRYRIPLHSFRMTFLCTVLLSLSNDQGCLHSSDFIICIKSVLFLLCFFCHHHALDQSILMAVWHFRSD